MTDRSDVPFGEALKVWTKIGCLSFGGPAGQIALMHRILVDERKWLTEKQYLSALNFCMLLPGPEAMQLATYSGWLMHGVRGGLAAGLMFVLPGALVVLLLSMLYAQIGQTPLVSALFIGIKAAVLAIVLEALLRVSKRALAGSRDWLLAFAAFLALFLFNLPFPLVIGVAAVIGWLTTADAGGGVVAERTRVPWMSTLRTVLLWLVIWFAPVVAVAVLVRPDHMLVDIGLFFSKLAVVTFGGAYAVLAYMAQQAVETHNWLTAEQMIDGLGLAETTPGPLILVTEFVGYMAGFRGSGLRGNPGAGLMAAAMTLWVTFAPCFLWIFAGAPYIDRLQHMPRVSGALAAITAAVVGVIANLSIWFGLHVLFGALDKVQAGPVHTIWPQWATIDLTALGLFMLAFVLLVVLCRSVLLTLAVCAALGMAVSLA